MSKLANRMNGGLSVGNTLRGDFEAIITEECVYLQRGVGKALLLLAGWLGRSICVCTSQPARGREEDEQVSGGGG